jgi:hypothetical protein
MCLQQDASFIMHIIQQMVQDAAAKLGIQGNRLTGIKRTVRVPPSHQTHLEHCHLLVEDAQQSCLQVKSSA